MLNRSFNFLYLNSHLLLAQAQSSASKDVEIKTLSDPSAKIDLLTQQLDFLENAYDKLIKASEFYINQSNNNSRLFLVILASLVTIIITIITFIYTKSLEEARKQIRDNINDEFKKTIAQEINLQKDVLTQMLEKELAVNEVEVIYLLPENIKSLDNPQEIDILKKRGFKITTNSKPESKKLGDKIIVLDLYNRSSQTTQDQIDLAFQTITENFPKNSILIIYYESFSQGIETLKKSRQVEFYSIANNRVTLMGALVDAAYVLKSLR